MTTEIDYNKIANFDLQDYVDNLTEEEKVAHFRNLSEWIQELEADAMWLENHDTYPYSNEFMADYITNHYVSLIDSLFTTNRRREGGCEITFTYTSGRTRTVWTIQDFLCMPKEYLLKMTMKTKRIPATKVKSHLIRFGVNIYV